MLKIFKAFLAYLIISTCLPQLSKFKMRSFVQKCPNWQNNFFHTPYPAFECCVFLGHSRYQDAMCRSIWTFVLENRQQMSFAQHISLPINPILAFRRLNWVSVTYNQKNPGDHTYSFFSHFTASTTLGEPRVGSLFSSLEGVLVMHNLGEELETNQDTISNYNYYHLLRTYYTSSFMLNIFMH